MKKCVPVLLFSVLSASVASHADSNVFQQKAEKTKNGIVADVNARQKMFSNRLKIQLQIDELRAELAAPEMPKKERICVKNWSLWSGKRNPYADGGVFSSVSSITFLPFRYLRARRMRLAWYTAE